MSADTSATAASDDATTRLSAAAASRTASLIMKSVETKDSERHRKYDESKHGVIALATITFVTIKTCDVTCEVTAIIANRETTIRYTSFMYKIVRMRVVVYMYITKEKTKLRTAVYIFLRKSLNPIIVR